MTNPSELISRDTIEAEGLALSVECDATPAAARTRLEAILGPATVVIASGGEWTDPATGEVEDKLHLHWHLTEPTQTPEDNAVLNEARRLATALVGSGATNVPLVHPIRWPRSGHREQHPHRLCQVSQGQGAADAEGTGDAIALAFTAAHGEGLRYDHDAGRWYRWEGDHWKADATGRTCSCCRTLSRTASADAADKVKAAPARRASPFSQAQRVARNTPASAETRSSDDQHSKCP